MTQPTQEIVVFRKWPNGDILALFPNIDDNRGMCSSYEHVGQHGGADYSSCISATKPAAPVEYADLLAELTSIGYDLKIRQRRNWSDLVRFPG